MRQMHFGGAVTATALLALTGCGESKMALDGSMDLNGTVRLDGPIQMQLSGPSITYTGTYVSEKLFDRIELKRTTGEWLVAVLGEPDSKSTLSDATEIWRWAYQPTSEQISPFTVWGGGGKDEPRVRQSLTFVQLQNGIVVDRWRD